MQLKNVTCVGLEMTYKQNTTKASQLRYLCKLYAKSIAMSNPVGDG
jgi:hypothetical protein